MRIAWTAVTILGLLALVGCAHLTGRTAGEIVDDAGITGAINAKIIKDPDLSVLKIDVDSTQGHVVLNGYVPNKDAERRLVSLAKEVRGVKSVTSELRVEPK